MIDWSAAQRVGGLLAGHPPAGLLPSDLVARARDYERHISDYTQLVPAQPLPALEGVTREQWIAANLTSMRPLLEQLGEGLGDGAGPLAGPMRNVAGLMLGVQAGALVGLLSQRVLGQYDLVLLDATAPTRLLLVTPNLAEVAGTFDVDHDELARWVTLHELTHAVQFTSVAWLRDYLAGLLRELLTGLQVRLDPRSALRSTAGVDWRGLAAAARRGELLRLAVGEQHGAQIDSIQAAMSLIEGHAEHVMDAVGVGLLDSLAHLRETLDRRRSTRSPAWRVAEKLLGLDLKMRQYTEGRTFCDAVVAAGGIPLLNVAFAAPESLPTLDELGAPERWIARNQPKSLLKSG